MTSSDAEDSGGALARARRSATGLLFFGGAFFLCEGVFPGSITKLTLATLCVPAHTEAQIIEFHTAGAGFQRQTVAMFCLSPRQPQPYRRLLPAELSRAVPPGWFDGVDCASGLGAFAHRVRNFAQPDHGARARFGNSHKILGNLRRHVCCGRELGPKTTECARQTDVYKKEKRERLEQAREPRI